MSSPDCPRIKFVFDGVGKKKSDTFDRFKKKLDEECRVQSRVITFLIEEVVADRITLPGSTINKKELKRRKSNLI